MSRTRQGSMGKVKVTTADRTSPDAARKLAKLINEVPLPKQIGSELDELPIQYKKRTHKASEPKAAPRSFRLSLSAERELKAIAQTLGIVNLTTANEAAIHAVARRLGIN